jgi:hypothetical protein
MVQSSHHSLSTFIYWLLIIYIFFKEFEAPLNLRFRNVNSTSVTLTFEYRLDTLKYLNKYFSTHMHLHHLASSLSMIRSNNLDEQYELIKSLHFAVFLKNRRFYEAETPALVHIKSAELVKMMQTNGRSFRNFTAMSCLNVSYLEAKKNGNSDESGMISFSYELSNLYPNTEYTIEMTARWLMLESQPTSTIKFTTLGMFLFLLRTIFLKLSRW